MTRYLGWRGSKCKPEVTSRPPWACAVALALVVALSFSLAGCTGGDSEKGVIKNKEKPVEPPQQKS